MGSPASITSAEAIAVEPTPPDSPLRLAVAAPHAEPSVTAIARVAARRDQLSRFYTPLFLRGWLPIAERGPHWIRDALRRELERRSFPGVPADKVETVASLSHGAYVAAGRLPRTPRSASLTSRLFFSAKNRFDAAVSRELLGSTWEAVIANDLSAELTLAAARKRGRLGILNVVDNHPRVHNRLLRDFCGLEHPHREVRTPAAVARVERELELADLVLVPSRVVGRQLASAGVGNDRVLVQPFGVNLASFVPRPRAERAPGSKLRCLYVGSVSYLKGMEILFEAARRLVRHPVEFTVVGRLVSPEVCEHVPDNVRVAAPVVRSAIPELMRAADVLVMPSLEDAFGLVVLEGMATALPVVVTDNVGASELITSGADGLVIPTGDAASLVEAVELLLASEDLRRELGAAARRRAEEAYSWDEYGERVLAAVSERLAVASGRQEAAPLPPDRLRT